MTGYEKLVGMMRAEGARKNEKGVFLAVMAGERKVSVSGLILDGDDLVFSEHLLTGYIAANGETVGKLRKGDRVLLKRLSDEKYAVIERVV